MENEEVEQNWANQKDIENKSSTLSPTNDGEMRHASNSSNGNNSSDEWC